MSTASNSHQLALDLFVASQPELAEQLRHLNPLAARAAGLSLEAYRQERLQEAFEDHAQRQGLFAWELTLQLTVDDPTELARQRLEVHREVAEMAHMDWQKYCELNRLDPEAP